MSPGNKFRFLELCCGSGTMSKAFSSLGWEVISLDKRYRKNTCEPTMKKDLLKLTNAPAVFGPVDVVWFSPPCQPWSYAAANYHFKNGIPQTKTTLDLIKVLHRGLNIIEELKPTYWLIENPQGRLRYYKRMIDFLVNNNGMTKKCSLSAYGFETPKPTNIFTNFHPLELTVLKDFGFGRKSSGKPLNNHSIIQKQTLPAALAASIANQVTEAISLCTWEELALHFKPEHKWLDQSTSQ